MTEAQRVRTGRDCAHCTLLDAHARADRLHLERVGHDEPREPELPAQQVDQDLAAHRRGAIAERTDDDVRRHDRLHALLDRRAEWDERRLVELIDERKREVRVDRGVAMPGEVLRARRHPRALEAAHERSYMARDERDRPSRTSGYRSPGSEGSC